MPRIKSIKQPLKSTSLPPRQSRHYKPLAEVYLISVPEVSRVVTKQDPKTGEFTTERKIVQHAVTRPMTDGEIKEARTRDRAMGSTQNYGKKNERERLGKKKVAQ